MGSCRKRERIPKTRGFTLVELLLASLLAVILLTAVGGLLRAVWRQERRTQQVVAMYPPTRFFSLQLQRDFTNARGLAVAPGHVRLVGFVSTDRTSLLPSLRPAEVIYRIAGSPQHRVLIRSERGLDELLATPKDEIAWVGAAAIDVLHSDLSEEAELTRLVSSVPGVRPMPRQIKIVVRDADGAVICSENVVHRDAI